MKADRTKRASKETIDRIYVESNLRDKSFVMSSPHCHAYCEIYYIEYGTCRFFIENNMYDLKSGDFLFIPPQVFHPLLRRTLQKDLAFLSRGGR